jgi:UDP-3-O-[3-hydroxymyristoyl] glucosamine N-acyltransferase
MTLGELAGQIGASLRGDGQVRIHGVAVLQSAGPGELSFLSNPRYRRFLSATRAEAVLVTPADADRVPVAALVVDDPYLAFARASGLLHPRPEVTPGQHPSALVDPAALVSPGAWVGPLCVVEAGARIAAGVFLGPCCIVARDCEVGAGSRLVARVTLCEGTRIGERVVVHPGAVLGREGFGFAWDGERWLRVPQLGRLILGNDVEVGANTTIDRGALEDTVIGDGVILDNQIQIAHNVRVGEHTAIAACTGISGSTRLGRNCLVGGDVGITGHLTIGDGVLLAAGAKVTRDLPGPGRYGGVLPVDPDPLWRRNVGRIRHLDELARRLIRLERRLEQASPEEGAAPVAGDSGDS